MRQEGDRVVLYYPVPERGPGNTGVVEVRGLQVQFHGNQVRAPLVGKKISVELGGRAREFKLHHKPPNNDWLFVHFTEGGSKIPVSCDRGGVVWDENRPDPVCCALLYTGGWLEVNGIVRFTNGGPEGWNYIKP